MDTRTKIFTFDSLPLEGAAVVARGRFDGLTLDHCRALEAARGGAARLVVVVESERAGILTPRARAELVAALEAVDAVVICDQPEAERLISSLNPVTVVDVESQVSRDVVADVLSRHPESG
jgi:bifunctional ADP-heptose synthase (sugar kinase/adenylyltransferase)